MNGARTRSSPAVVPARVPLAAPPSAEPTLAEPAMAAPPLPQPRSAPAPSAKRILAEPTLFGLIERMADRALWRQRHDGAFPPGCNGPYGDPETPVRNTAHWAITLLRLEELTGEGRWRAPARAAVRYLTTPQARPAGRTFHHRDRAGKDRCNGLVGQAWTFEALAAADRAGGDGASTRLAEEVFFFHDFDDALGLWHICDVDGSRLHIDGAFNHQLWFAACASLLEGNRRSEILARVARFLECCADNLVILGSGSIFHALRETRVPGRAQRRLKGALRWTPLRQLVPGLAADTAHLLRKSAGYHAFNLYAFALLRRGLSAADLPRSGSFRLEERPGWACEAGGGADLFRSTTFRRAVEHVSTERYAADLEDNEYGFPYNPPGFEVPFALAAFGELPDAALAAATQHWVSAQLARTLDPGALRLARNTRDAETLTARIYEAARLPEPLLRATAVTEIADEGRPVRGASP